MKDIMALLPDIALRFNIEHPSFEDCYLYGYECGQTDISESENPFPPQSKESEQWLEGWWAGFYGEPPLYEESLSQVSAQEYHSQKAANDSDYPDILGIVKKVLEITSLIAVSALLSYQVIDLVA